MIAINRMRCIADTGVFGTTHTVGSQPAQRATGWETAVDDASTAI